MKTRKKIASQTYLRRIFLWLSVSMLLPLTLYSIIAYYNVEQTVLKNEFRSNKNLLQQVKFNIDFMNDMIVNFVLLNYYNPDVSTIMYDKEVSIQDALLVMSKMKNASMNPFVQSIYIYNNQTQKYYSSLNNIFFDDTSLTQLFQSHKEIPKMKPILRKVEYAVADDKKRYEDVISYVMYDFKGADNTPNGALIVNANTAWLFKNINLINMVDGKKQDQMMILDDQNELIENNTDTTFNTSLKEVYKHHIIQASNNIASNETGFFIDYIDGKKYLITYEHAEKMNWTLVKAQLYEGVFQWINTLKYMFLILTLVFIVLIFIAARTISGTIYKPIGNLVRHVSEHQELDVSTSKDEISYLNEAYQNSIEQIKDYQTKRNSEKEIMKTYFLRKLLIDSYSISAADFTKVREENQVSLNPDSAFIVCVVKIDNLAEFTGKYSPQDQSLLHFGISNISSEWVGRGFPNEMIEMKNDYFVMLLNIRDPSESSYSQLVELWKTAQQYIFKYYKISISVTYNEIFSDFKKVSEHHLAALNNSVYRFLFGRACIIGPKDIQHNIESPRLGYSASLEKKLIDGFKSGSIEIVEEMLENIKMEIHDLSYNNITLSVMHLINSLQLTMVDIERSKIKIEPISVNFNLITQQLFEFETLDELFAEIHVLCFKVLNNGANVENEKQTILVEVIKEMIHSDYMNASICLSFIADKLHLSSKHIGRVFLAMTQLTVADYINEVRLSKAAEWLEASNLNIKEILVKIGVENESYFYRLFKKKYGITPKEYVLKKVLTKIQIKI